MATRVSHREVQPFLFLFFATRNPTLTLNLARVGSLPGRIAAGKGFRCAGDPDRGAVEGDAHAPGFCGVHAHPSAGQAPAVHQYPRRRLAPPQPFTVLRSQPANHSRGGPRAPLLQNLPSAYAPPKSAPHLQKARRRSLQHGGKPSCTFFGTPFHCIQHNRRNRSR